MKMYYSYSRISTDEQKQKFNRQEKALRKYAEQHDFEYFREFKDEASGANFNRTEFITMDEHLQSGDTVVIKEVSRFTRDAQAGYDKYMEWMNRGVNVVFIDNPTISTEYIKEMMKIADAQDLVTKTAMEGTIKLLLIVELDRAQKQREYISKAIKDGIAASNKNPGKKKGALDKMNIDLFYDLEKYNNDREVTQKYLIEKHKVSRNTIKKYAKLIKEGNYRQEDINK